ncbi:MAG: dihydroneopterin aldolase [Candidatus Melainabacteria bacterium]|nr:dihydroneopterin aldolase [Candidatus Melainabacteria bacterium]
MSSIELKESTNHIEKPLNKKVKCTAINVHNIPCYCSIGIHSEEKKLGQKLFIDVHVDVASDKLTNSDDINDTFSYVDIYKTVQRIAQSKPHSLIETLAEDLALSFLQHSFVLKARVIVRKPHIPFPEFQGDVSVEVERTK